MTQTTRAPSSAQLTVVLALLTLVALIGGLMTRHESAYTIAASGIGGLVASITAVFGTRDPELDIPDPFPTPTDPTQNGPATNV